MKRVLLMFLASGCMMSPALADIPNGGGPIPPFGDPPIANVYTTQDSVIEPELQDGSITITEIVEPVIPFRRGDADADGDLDLDDGVTMISHRTPGGLVPPCFKAADANDDGSVNVTDVVHLLSILFRSGPALPAPFMECGLDPTADELSCKSFPVCP